MGSDMALYVAAKSETELRKLLPTEFESVQFAEPCAFGRADASDWPASELSALAKKISKKRDSIILQYSSVTNFFSFICFRRGAAVRALGYRDGWRLAQGEPELWEAGLETAPVEGVNAPEFDAWTACALAGEHYRLTGWHRSSIAPAKQKEASRLLIQQLAKKMIDDKRDLARAATTLEGALEGVMFGIPIARELFAAHDEMFTLIDELGQVYTTEHECGEHGIERLLRVYTSREDVEMYMTTYEPPLVRVRPSDRLTGVEILALARSVGAQVFDVNFLGVSTGQRIHVETLRSCRR
jgi:hypothetical protein